MRISVVGHRDLECIDYLFFEAQLIEKLAQLFAVASLKIHPDGVLLKFLTQIRFQFRQPCNSI